MILTVVLAAIATVFATQGASRMEPGLALLVPLLVLAASTITVLQQRARWDDRIAGASAAVVALKRIDTAPSGGRLVVSPNDCRHEGCDIHGRF